MVKITINYSIKSLESLSVGHIYDARNKFRKYNSIRTFLRNKVKNQRKQI